MSIDTDVNYVEENPEVNYVEENEDNSTLIDTVSGEPSESDASGELSDTDVNEGNGSNESSEQLSSEGEPSNVDYEDFYKQCLQTVGKDADVITPKNLDEVRQLMSQGAQYNSLNKKYEEVSKLKSLLDVNKIDKSQLDLLIEINNGNTNALAKFLKDKNISPYDINPDDEAVQNYQAPSHDVDTRELKYTEALKNLASTEQGKNCLNTIISEWDDKSFEYLKDEPGLLPHISEQIANGSYKIICDELRREQQLGRYDYSKPFVQNYFEMGIAICQELGIHVPEASPMAPSFARTPAPQPLGYGHGSPKRTNNGRAKSAGVARGYNSGNPTLEQDPWSVSDTEWRKTHNL
jgi:hypothetical protein